MDSRRVKEWGSFYIRSHTPPHPPHRAIIGLDDIFKSFNLDFILCVCVCVYVAVQEIARGVGGGVADAVNLDVHAIAELQKKFPPTNDKPKYRYYSSEDQGKYRMCTK